MADFPVDMERPGPRLFVAPTYILSRHRNDRRDAASDVRCRRHRWLLLLGSLALGLVGFEAAHAAGPAIYKCLDNHLGLVYTDLPCKDGEKLDIRAGDADPAAVARLERIRDQLDQSAAQRISDERRLATGRILANIRRVPEDDMSAPQYAMAYAPNDYGYFTYPFERRRHPLHPHKQAQTRHIAPSPPYIVPRPAPH